MNYVIIAKARGIQVRPVGHIQPSTRFYPASKSLKYYIKNQKIISYVFLNHAVGQMTHSVPVHHAPSHIRVNRS